MTVLHQPISLATDMNHDISVGGLRLGTYTYLVRPQLVRGRGNGKSKGGYATEYRGQMRTCRSKSPKISLIPSRLRAGTHGAESFQPVLSSECFLLLSPVITFSITFCHLFSW